MGHVRKVPSKRQAVVDDDTKLNLLLALEENPITSARQLARDIYFCTYQDMHIKALFAWKVMSKTDLSWRDLGEYGLQRDPNISQNYVVGTRIYCPCIPTPLSRAGTEDVLIEFLHKTASYSDVDRNINQTLYIILQNPKIPKGTKGQNTPTNNYTLLMYDDTNTNEVRGNTEYGIITDYDGCRAVCRDIAYRRSYPYFVSQEKYNFNFIFLQTVK
ncbi:hypothetical protein NQ318_007842 [Aromia moschata]|uniref:Uncharacterized protein n=1 Tax=Aromia moschata TaxID=1265417 RepID=A0AAV8Z2H5_9CUCU|nr:hypothetical protein NQ318_007842 [Aromia moschata]